MDPERRRAAHARVGHISYSQLDQSRSFVELDIWMRNSSCCGHGWGSDALNALAVHLHRSFGIHELLLRPSARNVRAVRAYERAGFVRLTLTEQEQAGRYGPGEFHDTIVLQRLMTGARPTLSPQRKLA